MEIKLKKSNEIEYHIPVQRDDGSIYCYCDEWNDERKVSVSLNYSTKKLMCSVCAKEMGTENIK